MSEAAFYIVVSDHAKYGKFTYENDHIAKPIDEQIREIADLVWTDQWDDVVACYRVDTFAGTCVDAMRELAEAMDAQSQRLDVEPHCDTAAFIERVLKREAWSPERDPVPTGRKTWASQNTHWVP